MTAILGRGDHLPQDDKCGQCALIRQPLTMTAILGRGDHLPQDDKCGQCALIR